MKVKRFILVLAVICMVFICGCSSNKNIDMEALKAIEGEYQVVYIDDKDDYIGSWWHLSITDKGKPYLSIYDNQAGNPGVEGKIVSLDADRIKVEISPDYYDELPSNKWKDSGDYLEVTYEVTDAGITLTNNQRSLEFTRG